MAESVAHYTLLEEIGHGTLGPLHRARDSKTGRTVALRLLGESSDVERRTSLDAALRRATALSHPSMATMFEVGESDGRAFYAQEFVPGTPLVRLAGGQPINARRAIAYAIEIADALAEVEAAGLRHGGLTAASVIVTPKGRAKLLDVGFAEWSGGGPHNADDSDIAALGRLLTSMIEGPVPRAGAATMPRELAPVVEQCVSGGYESAAVVAAALRDVADTLESRNAPPQPVVVLHDKPAPKMVPWLIGLTLVAGAVWLIWYAVRSSSG